jgi:glycosyltransferase involved in cell wall biosynthesis
MVNTEITPNNSVFVFLSFEGPDSYSRAGGLGVRVTNMSDCLAEQGYLTHLFFIGDPHLKGMEIARGGKLILHRWCQWISQYYPHGVYQGEEGKLNDYTKSIPDYLIDNIIIPAAAENKIVVILSEEWHTAGATIKLANLLKNFHFRENTVIFWNANNVFGFERINWMDLSKSATITTISRFMKQYMWGMGLNPLVIPNGIPKDLLNKVNTYKATRFKRNIGCDLLLAKIARWDPDKRWNMAIEAVARLKARGLKTLLIARGGMESYGSEILYHARSLGLKVKDIFAAGDGTESYLEAIIGNSEDADLLNLNFYCPQDFLRLIYYGADGILSNSGREPFGLVGLETMAAGGVAYTGNTGEDYSINFHNSVVLDTSDPQEIESSVMYLAGHPELEERIRKGARYTAARFTWEQILTSLIQKLECQAKTQGLISIPQKAFSQPKAPAPLYQTTPGRYTALIPEVQPV